LWLSIDFDYREEVIQDEEDIEQQGSCQGGGLLDDGGKGGKGESWQGMPQVKGLKELKLPVGNERVWRV
jgi:hypothetical protein